MALIIVLTNKDKDDYINKYKTIMPDNLSDDEICQRLRDRIAQRIRLVDKEQRTSKSAREALDEEFDLLDLIDTDIYAEPAKKKKSTRAKIVKRVIHLFTDSVTSITKSAQRSTLQAAQVAATNQSNNADAMAAAGALEIVGVTVSALNIIIIPSIYLYHKLKGDKVPFNITNNTKIALSVMTIILAAVAVAVPPAGATIMIIGACFGVISSSYALGRFIYDRVKLNQRIDANVEKIISLSESIQTGSEAIKRRQEHIKSELAKDRPDIKTMAILTSGLKEQITNHKLDKEALVVARREQRNLKIESSKEKTIFSAISTTSRLIILCVAIAGVVLTLIPFTAPIGATILTVTAALAVTLFIAEKVHVARMRKLKEAMPLEMTLPSLTNTTVDAAKKLNPHAVKSQLANRDVHMADKPDKAVPLALDGHDAALPEPQQHEAPDSPPITPSHD